jgi:exonuclease SbcC
MIPRIIELKNFLSYGDTLQTVDFKNYDLICLSGKNGNGKSALLDALTWALWGQARKITGATKADEGLLHLGQTHMMVCVEFEFGKQIYRVRREFAKTYGKPYSALDFEIFDTSQQAYCSLTDKTVRTTQEKIEHLLGVDYDTFINTSFLRQGQANEFSKKNPKERKHILASILGLSKYDLLQQQAQDAMRHHTDEKKLITAFIDQSDKELEHESLLREQVTQTKEAHEKLTQQLQLFTHELSAQEQEKTVLSNLRTQHAQLQQEQGALEQKYQEKFNRVHNLLATWKAVHKATLLLPTLKELEEQKRTLIGQEKHFLELKQKNLALHEQQLHLKEKLQQRQTTLNADLEKNIYLKRLELEKLTMHLNQQKSMLTQKQTLLQELANKHSIMSTEHEKLHQHQATFETYIKNHQTIKKQFEKRRAAYQAFIQKGNWLKNTLQESEQKKKLVDDLSNPACPLCEQMLTAKRKQFLGAKLITHEHFLRHQMTRISVVIKQLKHLLLDQYKVLEQQEKELDRYKQCIEQERVLATTLAELTPACEKLVVEITQLQQQLDHGAASHHNHTQLLEQIEKDGLNIIAHDSEIEHIVHQIELIEQEKNTNMYDQAAYHTFQENIKQLDQSINTITQLQTEREQQTVRRTQIHHLINELKEHKKTLAQLKENVAVITGRLTQEAALLQAVECRKKELQELTQHKEQLTQQQACLEAELQRIEKIKGEQKTRQVQLGNLDQEIDDYQMLAQAFSKNGIQALLIEQAIPEIEQEANVLLARLTDNQAQIFIESLRDLKSGGVKESLDIHISDSAGIRPYEMYSGGEAFRVDFALRIAISKLLARRAGTALQTLIIDEGFGSQDEDGLAHITEALYAIKNDFSKIIIVSHLPNMKDSFPVQFIIEKQPSGSIVRIEERG